MNEGLNLNLLKQLTAKQRKQKAHKALEEIFGQNVYRLYYDLDTGKQFNPKRTEPKLKFDVEIIDGLKKNITTALARYQFSVVDFNKNIAANNRNSQQLKISKVLAQFDKGLLIKYNNYLDSLTRLTTGKYYAVISRHVADFAIMGTHFGTCESLEDAKDISDTYFGDPTDDNPAGDGNGERSYMMMKEGNLIFYMVKEGDWNIQQPVARFAEGVYCLETGPIYGEFSPKFKHFIKKWMTNFQLKVQKVGGLVDTEQFFQQSVEELGEKLKHSLMSRRAFNNMNTEEFIRGIIDTQRFDALAYALNNAHTDYKEAVIQNLVTICYRELSINVIKSFPKDIQETILKIVNKKIDDIHRHAMAISKSIDAILKGPQQYIQRFAEILHMFQKQKDDYGMLSVLGLKSDLGINIYKNSNATYVPFLTLGKLYSNQKASEVLSVAQKVYEYTHGKKQGQLLQSLKSAIQSLETVNEQMTRLKKLSGIKEGDERQLGKSLASQTSNQWIIIYRACPKDVNEFRDRDYVTLSRKFAVEHAENNHVYHDEPYHVIQAMVPTGQIFDAYNPGEYFYTGKPYRATEIYISKGPDEYEGYES